MANTDIATLAVDSAIYYGIAALRNTVLETVGSRNFFDQTEMMMKTAIFAGATFTWDNFLYEPLYDIFMKVGDKIQNPLTGTGADTARNLYIVFIQFLVSWYQRGVYSWGDEMWSALDEFVRLVGTDMVGGWVKPMLKRNNMLMTKAMLPGDVRGYSVESRGGEVVY